MQPPYSSAPTSVASAPGTEAQTTAAYNMAPMYNALPPNGQYAQPSQNMGAPPPPPPGGYMQQQPQQQQQQQQQAAHYPPVPGHAPGQAAPAAPGNPGAPQDAAQLICFD